MGADHQRARGVAALDHADHVARVGPHALERDREPRRARQRHAVRPGGRIDRLLELRERGARALEERLGDRLADAGREQAAGHVALRPRRLQRLTLVVARAIDHQQAESTVLASVDRLGAQLRMRRVHAAVEATGRIHLARLVAEHEHDLVVHVEAGVVVVVVAGSADAVAREDQRRLERAVRGEPDRLHLRSEREALASGFDRTGIADLGSRRHFHVLEVRAVVAAGREPQALHLGGQERRRRIDARRAHSSAFPARVGEPLHRRSDGVGRGGRRPDRGRRGLGAQRGDRRQQPDHDSRSLH